MKKLIILIMLFAFSAFSNAALQQVESQTYVINILGQNILQAKLLNQLQNNTFADCSNLICDVNVEITPLIDMDINAIDLTGSTIFSKSKQIAEYKEVLISTEKQEPNLLWNETNEEWYIDGTKLTVVKEKIKDKLKLKKNEKKIITFHFERLFQKSASDDITFTILGNEFSMYAWWNASFAYRAQTNIIQPNSTVEWLVAPVNFSAISLISGGYMQSNCSDLRAINSSQNQQFNSDLENATCNTGNTVLWTQFPYLLGGNQNNSFYTFYGSNTTANASTTDTYNQNNLTIVYHFGESNKSDGATISNAVTNNHHCTVASDSGNTNITGYWGSGMNFTKSQVNCTTTTSFTQTMGYDNWTMTMLIKRNGAFGTAGTGRTVIDTQGFWALDNADTDSFRFFYTQQAGGTCIVTSPYNFPINQWTALSVRLNNSVLSIWINGVLSAAGTCTSPISNTTTGTIILGRRTTVNATPTTIDEFRIHKQPVSDAFINVTHYLLLNGMNSIGATQSTADEIQVTLNTPSNTSYYNGNEWTSIAASNSTIANATLFINYTNGTNYITSLNQTNYNTTTGYTHYLTLNDTNNYTWNVLYYTTDSISMYANQWNYVQSDRSAPGVIITEPSPLNTSTYSSTEMIPINSSIIETQTDLSNLTCGYSLDGTAYVYWACGTNTTFSSMGLTNGTHNLTVNVTDNFQNSNVTILLFVVDGEGPNITVYSPLNQSTWATLTIDINTSITDALTNVSSCWYTHNNATTVYYNCSSATLIANIGSNTIQFFANDTFNNQNQSELITFFSNFTISCNYKYILVNQNTTLTEEHKVLTYNNEPLTSLNDYILLFFGIGIFALIGGILPPKSLSEGSTDAAKALEEERY